MRANVSGLSGTVTVTVATIPAASSNLASTLVSGTQMNLAWVDNSSNETGFNIQRFSNGGTSWTRIATVGQGVTTYSNETGPRSVRPGKRFSRGHNQIVRAKCLAALRSDDPATQAC